MNLDLNNNIKTNAWVRVRLEEVVTILDNFRVPINSDERAKRTGDIPYYGATGQVGFIDDYIFDQELVLLGEDGVPFFDWQKDVAYIIDGKSWVNNHAHVLRAVEGVTLNKFLLYFLNQFNYRGYVSGTTRLKLTQAKMKEIPVLLPPLAEQKRIVAKLDVLMEEVEAAREKLESFPETIKKFRQSVLAQAVSGKLTEEWREENKGGNWSTVLLGDLIADGPQNGLYKPQNYYGEGALIVRIDNFYDGVINSWDTIRRITLDEKESKLYSLDNDDLLINRVNSLNYLGKSALVRGLDELCVFESNIMRLKVNKNVVNPEYLIKYLNSSAGIIELRKNAKHAVNQASINQTDVKNVLVPLPSIEEQLIISQKVEALFTYADQLEEAYERAKESIDQLPQSILAKAFRGELVPQDPDDEPAIVLLERVKEERTKPKAKKDKKNKAEQLSFV